MLNSKIVLSMPILIPKDHPSFTGHFLHFPILPAVVLIDIMKADFVKFCQIQQLESFKVTGIKKMKFTGMLKPNDSIDIEWQIKNLSTAKATITKRGNKIAVGSFFISLPSIETPNHV